MYGYKCVFIFCRSWELQGRKMKGEYVMYKHENSPQQVKYVVIVNGKRK